MRRVSVVNDQIQLGEGHGTLEVRPGDLLFSSFYNAQRDVSSGVFYRMIFY